MAFPPSIFGQKQDCFQVVEASAVLGVGVTGAEAGRCGCPVTDVSACAFVPEVLKQANCSPLLMFHQSLAPCPPPLSGSETLGAGLCFREKADDPKHQISTTKQVVAKELDRVRSLGRGRTCTNWLQTRASGSV